MCSLPVGRRHPLSLTTPASPSHTGRANISTHMMPIGYSAPGEAVALPVGMFGSCVAGLQRVNVWNRRTPWPIHLGAYSPSRMSSNGWSSSCT